MSALQVIAGAFQLRATGPVRSCRTLNTKPGDRAGLYEAARSTLATPEFGEEDYDELYFVTDHHVVDSAGAVVSPIVDDIALKDDGYFITWSQLFWCEGFCIHEGRVAFLSIGADEGYCSFGGIIRYVVAGHGTRVDRDGLEACLTQEEIALTSAQVEKLELMAHHVDKWPHEFR